MKVIADRMPAYSINLNEFSHLLDNPPAAAPVALKCKLPAISRAGISILFPATRIQNFIQLVTAEFALKQEFLSSSQPVSHLRLRGFPLRQCSAEALTELLFRLCTNYKILDTDQGERSIDLALDQCTSDTLALLKGLGFSHIRVFVDASIASADRSLDPVRKAISTIKDFSAFNISVEIVYCTDTSRGYLKKLASYLFECSIDEIEFFRNHNSPALPAEVTINLQTFKIMAETLHRAGYRLIGDRCFKRKGHPDLMLLKEGRLGYGPWGFYNLATTEWLGLGPGADGMIAGYLYHNSSNIETYTESITSSHSPICSWSRHPMVEEQAFEFIQRLYCEHRVRKALFESRLPLLENLKRQNWMVEGKDYCTLTQDGILNLHTICNLYNLFQLADN